MPGEKITNATNTLISALDLLGELFNVYFNWFYEKECGHEINELCPSDRTSVTEKNIVVLTARKSQINV